jgi:hypothetical protein
MANDRLIFEIVAEGKNLKVVQRDSDALAKSVERTNTARDKGIKGGAKYHKQEKGIYQTGLSSAKGFSKMAQSIGSGSSGLVGAYATLAANVFAATAAFGALRSAAQVEQLAAGLEFVGLQGGRNLTAIADGLREITGLAISSEEAMRSVAIGTSAGFSTGQMEELTRVARGASLALGRDMGDAMNRLVRGAAKLEPEILDELGIMVRLDDATQKYADSIGVNVNSLSQYERRMAFINAINEQGIKNFGDLANAVDPNAYDVLSASLQDLYKNFVNLLNTGLAPVANFIAGSIPAMLGGVTMFGATISRQLAPSLFNAASAAAAAASGVQEMAANKLKDLKITKQFPKGYKAFNDSVIAGTASLEEMDQKQKELTNRIRTHQRHIDKYEGTVQTGPEDKERTGIKNLGDLERKKELVNDLTQAQIVNQEALDGGTKAQIKNAEAMGYSKAQFGSLGEGWAHITEAQKLEREETDRSNKTRGKARAGLASFGTGLVNVGKRAKFMGTALLNAIPAIGMIVFFVGLAWEAINKYILKTSAFDKAVEKSSESIDHINKSFRALHESTLLMDDEVSITMASWKSYSGSVQTATDAILALGKAQRDEAMVERQSMASRIASITEQQKALAKAAEEGDSGGLLGHRVDFEDGTMRFVKNAKEMEIAIVDLGKKIGPIRQQMKDIWADMDTVKNAEASAHVIETQAKALQQYGEKTSLEVSRMNKLASQVRDGTIKSNAAIEAQMIKISASAQNTAAAIQNAKDISQKFVKEVQKLANKSLTPYDSIIDQLDAMVAQFDIIKTRADEAFKAGLKTSPLSGQKIVTDASREARAEEERLNKALFEQLNLRKQNLAETRAGLIEYTKRVTRARNALIKNKAEVKLLGAAHKELANIAKGVPSFLKKQLDMEEAILDKKLQGLKADLQSKIQLLPYEVGSKEMAEATAALKIEILALEATRVSKAVQGLKVDIAREKHNLKMLQIQQAIANAATSTFKAKDSQLKAEMELAALQRRSGTRELSPRETFQLDIKAAQTALNTAKIQHSMKIRQQKIDFAIISMETQLLQQQTNERLAKERATAQKLADSTDIADQVVGITTLDKLEKEQTRTDSFFQNIFNLVTEKRDALKVLADQELNLAFAVKETSFAKAGQAFKSSVVGAMSGADTIAGVSNAYWRAMRSNKEQQAILRADAVKQAEKTYAMTTKGFDPNDMGDAASQIGAGHQAGTEFDTAMASANQFDFGDRVQMMKAQMQPMIEMIKSMGPEGELMAAVQEGMFATTNAVLDFADSWQNAGSKMEKVSAGIGLASSMTAQLGSIMAARSKMKIAAIDKEIELTKKLYGGTAKGEQMVAKLEAKKDAAKRKAFKQQKGIMMAQTIMGTAQGIMHAISTGMQAGLPAGPPLAAALASFVGVMGAAQLAMIAGMSYQGGGSAPKAGSPPKMNIGSRSNKVDVSGSRAGGELSYLRGERGMGTSASDFSRRGAFTGRYHRATGGAAYVVGEQGPELFVPEVPGQIVANDEMEEGGAMPNVTFNINAIDSSNMEETLVTQRGNIINMIREAANNQGETFLEGLDTMALGDSY